MTHIVQYTRQGCNHPSTYLEYKKVSAHTEEAWINLSPSAALVVLVSLLARLVGVHVGTWFLTVFRILNQPIFSSGGTNISIVTIILIIPVLLAASWSSRVARDAFEKTVVKRVSIDPTRQFSILSTVRVVAMIITAVIGLSLIGINLSSLTVIFGVLGIGLGFGLQDVVANIFAGLVIVFSHPVKEGDRIVVGQLEGTVHEIKMIHTVVTTPTNETIIVPNSQITGSMMHNYSYDSPHIVMCTSVQVSYRSDIEQVRDILLEIARRNPYGLRGVPDREPRFHLWSFDDSGITLRLCTWIGNAQERIVAMTWTNMEIWRAFRHHGIEIPYPQMDVHLKPMPFGSESEVAAAPGVPSAKY